MEPTGERSGDVTLGQRALTGDRPQWGRLWNGRMTTLVMIWCHISSAPQRSLPMDGRMR